MAFKVSSEDALPSNVLAALRAQGALDQGDATPAPQGFTLEEGTVRGADGTLYEIKRQGFHYGFTEALGLAIIVIFGGGLIDQIIRAVF